MHEHCALREVNVLRVAWRWAFFTARVTSYFVAQKRFGDEVMSTDQQERKPGRGMYRRELENKTQSTPFTILN